MDTKRGTSLEIAAPLLLVFIFFPILAAAGGEELYTRTDELSCGDTKVQAVTTCTEDSRGVLSSWCTEQHLLFTNRAMGQTVTVKPGHPYVHRNYEGRRVWVWIDGIAGDWACLKGKKGFYVVIRHMQGMLYRGWPRYEVFDEEGRRILSDGNPEGDYKREGSIRREFDRSWRLLGLPEPWPSDSFVSIQLFKEDRP